MRRKTVVAGALALVLLGCGDNTGPAGVPDAQLNIVRQDTLAPPLLATQASLWAKVGDGREVHLNYQGAGPGQIGEEYLRFEVPGDGLYRKPDGTAFLPGDSILITVTVVDPTRFHYEFEPSGLRFSAEHPARLKIRYFDAEHDFNEDGAVDRQDFIQSTKEQRVAWSKDWAQWWAANRDTFQFAPDRSSSPPPVVPPHKPLSPFGDKFSY